MMAGPRRSLGPYTRKTDGRGKHPAILIEQSWSNNNLLHGKRTLFPCRTKRVIPSGQESAILPARIANHRIRFTKIGISNKIKGESF